MYLEQRPIETVPVDPLEQAALFEGPQSPRTLTHSLLAPVYRRAGFIWWGLFLLCSGGVGCLAVAIYITLNRGIGAWGNNIPVAWAFGITNFVWWIGFGHAGTLISAILVLFQQKWRSSINRFAEAMTLCAITQAGIFPLMHLGRPWYFFWLIPYPSTLDVWPQFRSSLTWDVVAVMAYFLISLLFWYVGLLPDLAAARDFAPTDRKRLFYGVLSLGWRGSARHWHHWRTAYLLLAALATALVVSVESIVSFDFSIAQLPGWHTTIFPPYFVASAMFSGFALLLVLIIPTRKVLGYAHVVTERHLDLLNKMMLALCWMGIYGYVQENFFAWFTGDPFEMFTFHVKRAGLFSPVWYIQIFFTAIAPQVMWIKEVRRNRLASFVVGLGACVGAWAEQFEHVVPPLTRDFLPSSWEAYAPTLVDWTLLLGTVCFFGWLFLLFVKWIPFIPIQDSKDVHHKLALQAIEKKAVLERAGA